VLAAKFANGGQSCIAINRLFVHRDVHEELVARIADGAASLRLGHGAAEGTPLGPLIDEPALEKVERHVEDALSRGARALFGGRRWDPGRTRLAGAFYEPTILTQATDDMLISSEETFGPVLPVYSFDDDAEAVARANRTAYGLAAYLFGAEFGRIWKALDGLDFGVIGVNDAAPVRPELPFGGMKNSGQEREGGSEGIEAFLEAKSVAVQL
jgi:succinate-semialdehyde dehydrogenase / glutarate-semialdehyde dehydrogenase